MKDTKKLYESIMTSVAKEVKKAINEDGYNNYAEDEIDIQSDTEHWCDIIDEYLWNRSSADTETTLGLFATLVYLN